MRRIFQVLLGLVLVLALGWSCWSLLTGAAEGPSDLLAATRNPGPRARPPAATSRPAPKQAPPPLYVAPEPGEIRGVVRDRDGEIPVNHARVTVQLYTPRGERNYALVNSFKQVLDVDHEGRFHLQVPGGGWYKITAQATGFAPTTEDKLRPGCDVVLRMEVGAGLRGTVYAHETREPLSKVKVSGVPEGGGPRREAVTDEFGRFSMMELQEGTLILDFLHPLFVHKKGVEQTVTLGGRHQIEVELERGKLIKGAIVSALDEYPIEHATIKVGAKEVRSGEGGRFLMPGVPAEPIQVEVTARGFLAHSRSINLSGSRMSAKIEVRLQAGAQVSGDVRDEKGAPIVGAKIKIFNSYNNGRYMYVDWRYRQLKVETDKNGHYELTGLSANKWMTYAIGVTHEDYPDAFAREIKILSADDQIHTDITMGGGGSIEGHVRDQDGNPVSGARITLHSNTTYDWSSRNQNRKVVGTDAKGAFAFKGVTEGRYNLYANAQGYSTAWKSNIQVIGSSEQLGIEITVHKGEPLAGHVQDKQGEPLEGVLVQVRAKGAEGKVLSDAAGDFLIPSIPKAPYNVTATLESYARFYKNRLEPEGDGSLQIEMSRQPLIKGRVVDAATGKPIKRFQAVLSKKNDRRPGTTRAAARRWINDKEGQFSLQAKPETYRLEVYATGYVRFLKKDVKLELDREIEEIEVRLHKGGAIEGYARDPDGNPMRSVQIYVRESDDASDVFRRKGYTEWDGYFFLGDLSAQDHDVVLKSNTYPIWIQTGVRVGGAFPTSIEAVLERFTTLIIRAQWKPRKGATPGSRVVSFNSRNGRLVFNRYFRNRMQVTIEGLEKQKISLESKGRDAVLGRGYRISSRRKLAMRNSQRSYLRDLKPGPYRIISKVKGYPERVDFIRLDFSTRSEHLIKFEPEKKKEKPAAATSR